MKKFNQLDYQSSTKKLAKNLLGKVLVHQISPNIRLSGMIVETEAYLGINDPACHSYNNK